MQRQFRISFGFFMLSGYRIMKLTSHSSPALLLLWKKLIFIVYCAA